MRTLLLAGTSLLALSASVATAYWTRLSIPPARLTVPHRPLRNHAFGAQGGSGAGKVFRVAGGLGAEIGGDFPLTAGETLRFAVGGMGGGGTSVSGSSGGAAAAAAAPS